MIRVSWVSAILLAAVLIVVHSPAHADDRTLCDSNQATDFDAQIAACTRLIASGRFRGRDLAIYHYNRGNTYGRKNDFEHAIVDYDLSIAIDPKYAKAFNNRANALDRLGRLDRALDDFNQAIRLDPKLITSYRGRGNVLRKKGDLAGAIDSYGQALRIDPRDINAYRSRADVWRTKGDLAAAIGDYTQALSIDPKDMFSYQNRGELLRQTGELDRALADLDKAIALKPAEAYPRNSRGLVWYTKGTRHREKGERDNASAAFDRAKSDFDEAIRLHPKYEQAYFNRASTWAAKGDNDRALADYGTAIEINPKSVGAFNNRANILRSKREFDQSIADLNAALRIDPAYTLALANRGLTYEAKGESDRARADYRLVLNTSGKAEYHERAKAIAQKRLALLSPGEGVRPSQPPVQSQPPASARLALIIGNGAYSTARLDNPPNDARAVAAALREIGFEVIEAIDLDQAGMKRVLIDFLLKTSSAKIALLYYAGHGIQIDGKNYLIPTDARLTTKKAAAFELIDVDEMILRNLEGDETRANILILDACRDNPFESRIAGTRSLSRGSGLNEYTDAAAGTLIAFATAGGKTAEDGSGTHSPFTQALLKHIRTPNLEVNEMLTRVRADVFNVTDKKQKPWAHNSLLGPVYLVDQRTRAAVQ